jgi:hypothetical protein
MTAKEKAQELVEKFNKNEKLFHSIDFYQAKQCALIAVNEILDVCKTYLSPYYNEVKKEIEKL